MYKYFNPNPVTNTAGDCVIRAICAATGQPWRDVYNDLCSEGMKKGDWGSNNNVWGAYLKKIGFDRFIVPSICPDCYTIADFAADRPQGIYIVATGSHVVTVIDGDWYDTWDSGAKVPLYYFM